MSRSRTAVHLVVSAAAVVLTVAWVASAMPMQAKPGGSQGAITIEDVAHGVAPRKVKDVKPMYPADAARQGVEGLFVMDVVIGRDGAVREAKLIESAPSAERSKEIAPKQGSAAALEGDPRLAQAALDAVKQWQYEPVVKEGKPVEAHLTVTVAFKLQQKDDKTKP